MKPEQSAEVANPPRAQSPAPPVVAEVGSDGDLAVIRAALWRVGRRNALQLVALVAGFLLALRVFRRRG